MKCINLAYPLDQDTPLYGGEKRVFFQEGKSQKSGDSCNTTQLNITSHDGTHVDMPFHFVGEGKTLTDYDDQDWCFSKVALMDFNTGGEEITPSLFENYPDHSDLEVILLKTGMIKMRGQKEYIFNSPIIRPECAKALKEKFPSLRAIGLDCISISSQKDRMVGREAHKAFLGEEILIIEDMNLDKIDHSPDQMILSPLLFQGGDGAPANIWALYSEFWAERYETFFFDFDGVVLDSMHIKTDAFYDLYLPFGEDVAEKAKAHHLANGGVSRFKKLEIYHRDYVGREIQEGEKEELLERFSELVFDKVLKAPFIQGAKEFLTWIKESDRQAFIVTGTPQDEMEQILKHRGLEGFFQKAYGSPKNKIENLDLIFQEHPEIKREKAVFFGDAITDLKAADHHFISFKGINYPGLKTGYDHFDELRKVQREYL